MARLLLVLAATLLIHVPAYAAEVIRSFESVVQVARNGDLTVTETIRVVAEGRSIKRGIFRDFPLAFTGPEGRLHEVTFELLDVLRDGRPEPHFTRRNGKGLRIYAGAKDVTIPRGEHTYVFRYRTGRQIRWFDGKPELNWNVTGNFWDFPIETARYRLDLLGSAAPERWTAFTGRLGQRGTDWQGAIGSDGVLTVTTTRTLAPGEGLSVVAALPATAVEPPSQSTLLWWSFLDNRRWIIGGAGFLLVLIYYVAAWSAVGRDPRGGVIIPLFHPPQGVSPALANYLHNWGLGRDKWRAFTAAALSLAVRGVLTFDDRNDKLTLKVAGQKPERGMVTLPPGEQTIYRWVTSRGGTASIDKSNGSAVAKVGTDFTSSIESENKNRFFRRNIGWVLAGLALTVVVIVGLVAFGGLQEQDLLVLFGAGMAGLFLGLFLIPLIMSLFSALRFQSVVRSALTLIGIGVFLTFTLNFIGLIVRDSGGEALPAIWGFLSAYPFSLVLIASFAALNGLFLYLMRAPTALGRPIMDQLAGFRLYLETAEADRLNYQAPEITTERFEALLPYAVALGVEKPWAEAFAAALKRAHPDDPDPMRSYQPAWHSGSRWSTDSFSTGVAATVAGVSSAFASAVPVSSGSSGFSSSSGGSGSGGGGGGGGGW